MSIYDDLEQLVDNSKRCDVCNTAKGDWELKRDTNGYVALKYKGAFVVLHDPKVSTEPTVCENTVRTFGLDSNKMMSLIGIAV